MEFIETYYPCHAWQNIMYNQHHCTVPRAIFIPGPLESKPIKDSWSPSHVFSTVRSVYVKWANCLLTETLAIFHCNKNSIGLPDSFLF